MTYVSLKFILSVIVNPWIMDMWAALSIVSTVLVKILVILNPANYMLTFSGFSLIHLRYILLYIPLKWSLILQKSSTAYFSNSTGSSVTNRRFFLDLDVLDIHSHFWLLITSACVHKEVGTCTMMSPWHLKYCTFRVQRWETNVWQVEFQSFNKN